MSSNAARAATGTESLAAGAEAKARDLSSVALDQLFARIDDIGDAVSNLSKDAASLARSEADTFLDALVEELSLHPMRSLAIAVGLGVTAGLYLRR
jgi:ElaB/YqjD/DUF883 family membrane-anchored ribosome-binding protein